MESILYDRIDELCTEHHLSIRALERNLGMSPGSIRKLKKGSSPSIDRLVKIAEYFRVSMEYLVGMTDTRAMADDLLMDKDMVLLQRAWERMTAEERDRTMRLLRDGLVLPVLKETKQD